MTTFDRHLLREWFTILLMVLALTCGILLIQVMFDDFRDLREAGARGLDMLRYIAVTIPSFLALVLPMVLLVSTLFVLGKLHRANEFTAMRASGVGFGRLMAPLWGVAILSCGLSWMLNSTIVPWSVAQSHALKEEFLFRKEAHSLSNDQIGSVESVGFDNPVARRMWFFNRYSQYTRKAYGASVTELDARLRETRRVEAAEAWYDPARGGWVFHGGRELVFDPDATGARAGGHPLRYDETESWHALSGELGRENTGLSTPFTERFYPQFKEDPDLMLLIDRRPIDLSFFDLRRLIDYFAEQGNPKGVPYAVRYYGLIADTFGPLIVIAIAIPFAVAGVRLNPAVGVSKAIGLFFLYYVLSSVAGALAGRQLVDPTLAAWLPNLGMTGIAGCLFLRLR